ncbi:somatostatin receptor type 5-like [Liolophura sinensis]|uniref:somatostatin receptor type 5-like n=1 Tax=Liolophura sinensis TaxID=3198878 RepID=UPI00315857BE
MGIRDNFSTNTDSNTSLNLMDPCYQEFDRMDFISDDFFEMDFTSVRNRTNCSGTLHTWTHSGKPLFIQVFGETMYAWLTPVILIIGILGNSLSLSVFTSKNMRSLSASNYLAALSLSDLMTLIFFVFIQWLQRGLKLLPGHVRVDFLAVTGVCHLLMYLGYIFRFLSAWLVVIFTVERYIGVCHPLRRRSISTASSRKIILCLVLVSAVLLIYKPILSGPIEMVGEKHCVSLPEHKKVSEILDSIYGVLITLVPFILITALNLLIIRKLVQRNRRQRECSVMTEESIIRLEFTLILLAISLCFIAFNLPYFTFWIQTVFESKTQKSAYDLTSKSHTTGVLYIVRAIFYMNYCVNFFLYSITGAYFRREVKMIFRYKMGQGGGYSKCSKAHYQNSQTNQTWTSDAHQQPGRTCNDIPLMQLRKT